MQLSIHYYKAELQAGTYGMLKLDVRRKKKKKEGGSSVTSLRSLKERNHHQAVNRGNHGLLADSFELAGKGFFFFFVVVKNGFDMFCNVVQVMLENTFTQFVDFVSSFKSLL